MGSKLKTLTAEQRRQAQQVTLGSPRMRYSILPRLLFMTMDLVYGRKKTFSKFKVLELIARVPYQSWENVAYIAITHMYADREFARRVFDRVKEAREAQDNEMWHLLILEELTHARGIKENVLLHRILPQVIAFTYYQICWLLYVIKPSWSYLVNAQFEDHAEHEYMEFVAENPQFESEPFKSLFEEDYASFESVADIFRQIGHDERMHKEESLEWLAAARFQ
ncbi:alternative oxidase [Candidatus Methylomirabilis sp.]|uniref:alternative oxidase n=1 Tax=Candidatus Methylomirabilis sp. TaxID=2032687 RepID=UPI0030767A95